MIVNVFKPSVLSYRPCFAYICCGPPATISVCLGKWRGIEIVLVGHVTLRERSLRPTLDLLSKSPGAHLPRVQVPGSAGESLDRLVREASLRST